MIKIFYILLCAAVLSYTTVFARQPHTFPELAQSGSAGAQIEPSAPTGPTDETAAEEVVIEPEPEVAEEATLELQAEAEIEPEPEKAAWADACDEARKWYNEGLNLSDNSAREVAYYQRAIELCPDFSAAHNRLGEVYKSRGEYESALEEFNQAKKWSLLREPGTDQRGDRSLLVQQYINQGEVYRMQGRYDLAAGQYKRALKINPGSRLAMNKLQYVNKLSGKYDDLLLPLLQTMSSPIFTRQPGMALPKGIFSAGFLVRWWTQEATLSEDMFVGGLPDPFRPALPYERSTDVLQVVLDLRYGLTDNFTIGLFPRWSTIWFDMQLDASAEEKVTGIGDTNLLTKYQFFKTRNTRISLFHLLSIPTGDEETRAGQFNTIVPLGSGSFNFTPGIAFTTKKEYLEAPLTIHSNISYRFTNDEWVGDELRCDLAFSYPFSPDINSFLELNYRWRDSFIHPQTITVGRDRPMFSGGQAQFETAIEEKSGHTLFLSPGFQFILYKDIRLNVGAQIPLIKPEGGWAEKFVLNFGLRGFWDKNWW